MAHSVACLENSHTGQKREAPIGFSWTNLFLGFFVPLSRTDWKWAAIQFFAALITAGLCWLVFPFLYNRLYLRDLLNNGFEFRGVSKGDPKMAAAYVDSLVKPLLVETSLTAQAKPVSPPLNVPLEISKQMPRSHSREFPISPTRLALVIALGLSAVAAYWFLLRAERPVNLVSSSEIRHSFDHQGTLFSTQPARTLDTTLFAPVSGKIILTFDPELHDIGLRYPNGSEFVLRGATQGGADSPPSVSSDTPTGTIKLYQNDCQFKSDQVSSGREGAFTIAIDVAKLKDINGDGAGELIIDEETCFIRPDLMNPTFCTVISLRENAPVVVYQGQGEFEWAKEKGYYVIKRAEVLGAFSSVWRSTGWMEPMNAIMGS